VGETKAGANRLTNADHANLVRTSRAAHTQLEALRRLEREHRLDELSPRLRETAELRLRHPSLPLRELGLKCRPTVSKAAVHRRLQKLIELAET
jgi:cell division protein WhiA